MDREGAPRIVVAGGGTGGHLFPALEVADELKRRHPAAEIVFVGARRGIETRLVPARGYPLRTMRLSGVKGVGPAARVVALASAAFGLLRCAAWMVARRPDLVVGVGGYASGPAVLAAHWLGVKTMVMEQNHYPGATNRFLARKVKAVCVPSEAAQRRLGGRAIVTGNPVRAGFSRSGDLPGAAELSLLVFGGSRGARAINRAVVECLRRLAAIDPPPRIVHQTGEDDAASVEQAYAGYAGRSEVRAFLDDMPARLAGADLVVSRAGASTLAELAASGRPAILVPYPYASDDHQTLNARAVADAGAAVVLAESEFGEGRLAELVRSLHEDRGRLRRMAAAAATLARPDATRRVADVADALLAGRPPCGADARADGGGARVP